MAVHGLRVVRGNLLLAVCASFAKYARRRLEDPDKTLLLSALTSVYIESEKDWTRQNSIDVSRALVNKNR